MKMGLVRKNCKRLATAFAILVISSNSILFGASSDIVPNDKCMECHSDKDLFKTNSAGHGISLFLDERIFKNSSHGRTACAECHNEITSEHPDNGIIPKPVNCTRCHETATSSYDASVHGLALKAGGASASCVDCHGTHAMLPSLSSASSLHFTRQAETCGNCHEQQAQDFANSVHGHALAAGVRDAPTCTDCHSEHRIEALTTASPQKVSRDVCSKCHASERLNTKYKLPADRVKTFFESYHGLASAYGSTVTANCASCHDYHKVLPSTDPDSSIHKTHLVATCGKCHPGANDMFAAGKIHVNLESASSGPEISDQVNWWVRKLYLILIFVVIGGMLIHNGLIFFKKVAAHLRSTGRPVLRMNLSQRWQHAVLASSFIILAVTGFALKFPDSWLAKMMGSSEPFRRWSHRIAGVVLLVIGIYHIVYILTSKDGRRLVKDLLPVKKDVADVKGSIRYLSGLSKTKAKIGRFGYAEKMEYWAVVWGTIIMGVTGLMIWFKMDVTQWLPRWLVDVALTIHYYEAILACLAIIVWHFYHVIFDPDVYPLNMACVDGKVSEHWQEEEHPLDMPFENHRDQSATTSVNGSTPSGEIVGDNHPTPSGQQKAPDYLI
jgi:formate dehydrogenase gamma subunit